MILTPQTTYLNLLGLSDPVGLMIFYTYVILVFGSLFGGVSRLRRAKRKALAFHHARQEPCF